MKVMEIGKPKQNLLTTILDCTIRRNKSKSNDLSDNSFLRFMLIEKEQQNHEYQQIITQLENQLKILENKKSEPVFFTPFFNFDHLLDFKPAMFLNDNMFNKYEELFGNHFEDFITKDILTFKEKIISMQNETNVIIWKSQFINDINLMAYLHKPEILIFQFEDQPVTSSIPFNCESVL